jgi:methanogenic corrinoid protein MtbC1
VEASPISSLSGDYLAALLAGDAVRARWLVDSAVEQGTPVLDVYLHVLTPALVEVGERWASGEISVADEHYATAITQGIIGALAPRIRTRPSSGRLAIVACAPGEQHALGSQMVTDVLEAHGWEAIGLGASMPAADLAAMVDAERPDAVCLSASVPETMPGLADALARMRAQDDPPLLIVGGRAWLDLPPDQAAGFGADAQVSDPLELIRVLTERFPPAIDEEPD